MNRSTGLLIVLAIVVSIAATVPLCAITWNAAADYHAAYTAGVYTYNNWSYGYTSGASASLTAGYTFGLMNAHDNTFQAHERMNGIPGASVYSALFYNPSDTDSTGTGIIAHGLGMLPADNDYYKTALRFTAPTTGTYTVAATFQLYWDTQPSAMTDSHVVKYINSTNVQELAGAVLVDASPVLSYNNSVLLNAGESLDFIVGNGGNGQGYDMNRVAVTIVNVAGGTVSGTVSGPSGAISGATVVVVGGTGSTTTASNGTYSLPLPVGTYTLKAGKTGYISQQLTNVAVTDGGTTTKNFSLTVPNWQQVGSTTPGVAISTPDNDTTWTTFSATGDMPASLAIAGGVLPNLKATYRVWCSGISGWGNQTIGRHGLGLYCSSSPVINDGLYGGFDIWYSNNGYYGAIAGPTGSPADPTGGTCLLTLDQWGALGYPLIDFDATMEVVEGVVTTTLVSRTTGVAGSVKSYTVTPSDISNWGGQMKYVVFKADSTYSRTFVSDVVLYKDANQVLPQGAIQGNITLNGSAAGAGVTVTTTDGAFSTLADSAGHYSLTLAPGTFTLTANKTGFVSQTQGPISLANGQTVTQNFNLTGPNWVQAAPTITTTYATPATVASAPQFSEVGQMPITLEAAGGVLPNLKVTYALSTTSIDPGSWGFQPNGNTGLALFVPSTPTPSVGMFTGVSHPGGPVGEATSAGAIVGNNSQMPAPSASFTPYGSYNVTVEAVGTAWTTLANVNTGAYTVTGTDISNWSGNLGFAAFKSDPGANWAYSRTFVSNITFYRDANQAPTNAGFIRGHVTSTLPGNPPIAGADIRALGDDSVITTTDSAGYYEMTARPGDYVLRSRASGYVTQEPNIHLNAGQTLTYDVALVHSGTWDLFADYNTFANPNGQWSYGYTEDLNAPLIKWANYSQFDGGLGNMSVWTRDAGPAPNPWYGWLTKNSTGSPITWNCPQGDPVVYIPSGYVENNDMCFGGGGGWWMSSPVGAVYPRIRWTSPDQRMVKVYFKISGQSPTSRTGILTLAKNNQPSAMKSFTGFSGRAVVGYTDSVGPSPTATFETQLLVSTGDTIDFIQGRHAPEFGVTGAWADCFGYPWAGMAIWVTVSPGDAQICNSITDLQSKAVGTTVYMNTPVQIASATSGAGTFDKKYGDPNRPVTPEYTFYIQSADKVKGMKCISDGTLTSYDPTNKIIFTGKIEADAVNPAQKVVRVMSINTAVAGAAAQPLGKGSKGLTNTGTLVRVWGKVVSLTPNPNPEIDSASGATKWNYEYITINDGAGDIKIAMHVQGNWMSITDGNIASLAVGQYVSVTGIAGTTTGTDVVVYPRVPSDIRNYAGQ